MTLFIEEQRQYRAEQREEMRQFREEQRQYREEQRAEQHEFRQENNARLGRVETNIARVYLTIIGLMGNHHRWRHHPEGAWLTRRKQGRV